MAFVDGSKWVRVPATSANLGSGFDSLGLALTLYDQVGARVTDGPTTVTVTGEGADQLPTDERHLVVRAMRATFEQLGVRRVHTAVTCHNRIPQARGLGSSAAAILAGVLLARALVDSGPRRLDDDAVLRLASRLEGHPDNVAACLLGGATLAWEPLPGMTRAIRLRLADAVRPVVFVPTQHSSTSEARAALPATVPHADAAHAAARAALLVHALASAPERLFDATEDRLHQPYRAPGIPASSGLLHRLRAAGIPAVISGAGPSVLALSDVPGYFAAGPELVRHDLEVDTTGAVVGTGTMVVHAA